MVAKLPMAALSEMKILELDNEQSKVTVPYKFLNKNPFNSTYWAVQGMAAEMASGIVLQMKLHDYEENISTYVLSCNAKFVKTANDVTTFVFKQGKDFDTAIQNTIKTGEGINVVTETIGFNKAGVIVSEWEFVWGIKVRK